MAKLVIRLARALALAFGASALASPICVGIDLVLRAAGLSPGSTPAMSFLDWFAFSAPVVIVLGSASVLAAFGVVNLSGLRSWRSRTAALFGIGGLLFSALLVIPVADPELGRLVSGYLTGFPIWVTVLGLWRLAAARVT